MVDSRVAEVHVFVSFFVALVMGSYFFEAIGFGGGVGVGCYDVPGNSTFGCVVKRRVCSCENEWLICQDLRRKHVTDVVYGLTLMYDVLPVIPNETDLVTDAMADTNIMGSS